MSNLEAVRFSRCRSKVRDPILAPLFSGVLSSPAQQEAIQQEIGYLVKHHEWMLYKTYRKAGCFIGSGELRRAPSVCVARGVGLVYNRRVSELFKTPIGGTTRFCAVFGHPVKHSASPAFQNAGIAALGLNWRYLAFEVHPDLLREALAGTCAMNFIGVNLTVPHKLLAVELVDVLDESARQWGAVNTVRFEGLDADGQWQPLRVFGDTAPRQVRTHGFNTDAGAISRAAEEDLGLKLRGARVLLLGAGGAGRTAALKLADDGVAELFLVNRTTSKAEAVAAEIRRRWPAVQVAVGYPKITVDLLLNATSLGLRPDDPLPLDQAQFSLSQARAVYDMIYRPAETPLLAHAKAAGCRVANGLGMLLYQGAKALEIWSGQPAPVAIMREALERNVYGR